MRQIFYLIAGFIIMVLYIYKRDDSLLIVGLSCFVLSDLAEIKEKLEKPCDHIEA